MHSAIQMTQVLYRDFDTRNCRYLEGAFSHAEETQQGMKSLWKFCAVMLVLEVAVMAEGMSVADKWAVFPA